MGYILLLLIYCRYTCRTPVERDRAREEISDNEVLNVERFFSTHVVRSPDPSLQEDEEMVTTDELSSQEESVDDNIPDSPNELPALVDMVIESKLVGYVDIWWTQEVQLDLQHHRWKPLGYTRRHRDTTGRHHM